MSPVVLAQHVTKSYGPRRAVTDVSFAIEQGEIVGLLGPNGSGKSTIFRMLTGYLAPTSGRIEVAGHDVVAESLAVRRAISYVPEDAPLYDHMRVGEFLHFMASIKGLRGSAARRAVDASAERLDLTGVMTLLTGDALKETAGGLMLRLSAAAPEDAIRRAVAAIAGMRSISADPDGDGGAPRYLIEAERRPSIAADIVAALVAAGIAVFELTEHRPALERVFLELTRGPARVAA